GAYTGQELRAELDAAGVEVCNVSTESGLRRILEQVRPDAVINHSGWFPNPVRTGVERWIAVGHSALPMPFGYDAYVAISEFHAQFQRHLPPERLVRIPNGVHLKDFGRRRRPAGQPVTIVMLSRLAPGKFPRRLLDYVFPLAGLDARVLIAGYGRRRFEIEPEISRRGLEKIVSFIGPIPTAQVPRFLGEADIGLHLTETHEELCSMTILEMMASGLPIVAEPKGSLPEMIAHGSNGFLTMDEGEIAGHLEDLIASPELRRRLGEASKAAAARYDFARFRASLLDLVGPVSRSGEKDTQESSVGGVAHRVIRAAHTGGRPARPRMEKWRPTISYLVCASPRSGSNLLCESLTNTGFAGWPDEFFCRLADRWSLPECGETTDIEEYLAWLLEDRSTPNAVFGAKIMRDHFVDLCAELRTLPGRSALSSHACLQSVFPGLRYVWMTRRDKLRQAISRVRAEQTGQWRQHDGDLVLQVAEPRFSRKEIARGLEEIELQEAGWQTFFTESGARPVVVVYEELVGSYEATARRVAKELGIALPRKVWFGERRLLSQSDARTDKWVRRFSRQQSDARELPSVQAPPSRTSPSTGRRLPRSSTASASLPDANSPESKLDLDDVTFLIPVHPDSTHRERNLRLTIAYLSKHFSTRIVVGEQGESPMANALRDLMSGFEAFSLASTGPRFHRTLLLNRMLEFVGTPFVANYDCDVLFPLRQYVNAVSMLRAGEADFVFPYDGRCYDVPEPAQDDLLATLPWRDRRVEPFRNMIPG
ncbi:MAG TPA: Stf0 family sulfotransferase, partial [Thermoanaerobaculia bacterium]|nr:Stf0 family sulfotransferase [Thermoanaerobaculia bacterium]